MRCPKCNSTAIKEESYDSGVDVDINYICKKCGYDWWDSLG